MKYLNMLIDSWDICDGIRLLFPGTVKRGSCCCASVSQLLRAAQKVSRSYAETS
jgi:hypothetical protein